MAREQVASILSLHPDVLTGANPRNGLEFAFETGVPATRQMWLSPFFEEYQIADTEQLRQRNSWTYPDGSPVKDAEGILAEEFDGSPYARWDGKVIPSIFAPGMIDLIQVEARGHFDRGYAAIQFGNIRIPRIRGLDFSIWAQAAFRNHLKELSASRLDELGVEDPDSFDIRGHLEAEGLAPGSSTHPADDPTFREYLLFHHRGVKALLRKLHKWVGDAFPQRSPPFYLDQPMGDPHLWECAVAETYASEHVDIVSVEDYRTMPADEFGLGGNPNRMVPDKDIRDFIYKLMWATTRHEKPIQVWDTFGGEYYSDINSGDEYPMLLRLQAAEAYAMGCQRRLALRDAPFSWKEQDGRLPEVLKQFIDFLWAHQRFLRNARPENRVAVVWSLPTLLWNTIPQWGIHAKDHTSSFLGTATLLRESQIPYDVIVFGQENLWPDAENLDRLLGYDAIILPGVEGISRAQLAALDEFLSGGGLLVVSGTLPDRNGSFEPIEEGGEVFGHDNVVVLEADPGRSRITGDESEESIIAELNHHGIGSVTTRRDNSIGVNHLAQPSASRHLFHLLNYDYDPGVDEFQRKRDVEIRLDGVPGEYSYARYYSPQGIEELEIIGGESRQVTVPDLVEWGFVVLAPTESHVGDEGKPSDAEVAVKHAANSIQKAREEGRDLSIEYAIAEEKLQAAKTAIEYKAHSLARQSAKEATEWADNAYGQPVVAFDHAHVQPESLGKNVVEIEQYQERFPGYVFKAITEWDETVLSDVDVLVVPPALAFMDQSYGFISQELDQIDAFVANGGSIMVLGSGAMASDIDVLTERLDFRFLKNNIVDETDKKVLAETTDCWTELTEGIDTFDMTTGTAIETLPEQGTVLARITEDTTAWIHESGDLHQRDNGEKSAAGLPVFTVHHYGDGLVTALGHRRYHYSSHVFDDGNPIVGNSLSVLGQHAQQSRSKSRQGPSDTATPIGQSLDAPATTSHASTSQPGFGVVAALASISGAALLLRWLRRRDR